MTIPASDHLTLAPRGTNDNGTNNSNIPTEAIIVIVLVAAGFVVLIGYSITRFFSSQHNFRDPPSAGEEQVQHMRTVRQRNLKQMGLEAKQPYYIREHPLSGTETGRSNQKSYATREPFCPP